MATKRTKPPARKRSNWKIQDDQHLAIIMSHAATFGPGAAAKEFGLNRKTIQRYQADMREGKRPELSALVASETDSARARSRSKIQRALDALLDRVIQLAPTAELGQAIVGVEKIGDLATTRKVLGVESDSEGQAAPGNEGLGGRAEGRESESPSQPVH